MIIHFAKVEGDRVTGFFEGDDEGPLDVDFPYRPVSETVDSFPVAPTPSSELRIGADGALFWEDTVSLSEHKSAAVNKTYKDVDLVYDDAIGSREKEYTDAEAEARRFAAAGYTGPVNSDVSAYAQYNPTGQQQTNQWAADQIISRADAFAMAKRLMRSTRFACQAQMQASTTAEQLAAAVAIWVDFISTLRSQLGLPPGGI